MADGILDTEKNQHNKHAAKNFPAAFGGDDIRGRLGHSEILGTGIRKY